MDEQVDASARGISKSPISRTFIERARQATGNYRVVLVQGATANDPTGSSSIRKFKIVK